MSKSNRRIVQPPWAERNGVTSENNSACDEMPGFVYLPQVLAQPTDLDPFLAVIDGWALDWSVCTFGRNEAACLRHAMEQGGNVRTGFENNFHLPNGQVAHDNSELVRLTRIAGLSLGLVPQSHPEQVP